MEIYSHFQALQCCLFVTLLLLFCTEDRFTLNNRWKVEFGGLYQTNVIAKQDGGSLELCRLKEKAGAEEITQTMKLNTSRI